MHRAFNVYLGKKLIDTVFFTHPEGYKTVSDRVQDVKESLINHDGYNPNIKVREVKK